MEKDIKVGVMQGRLLPKYKGRYQAHPISKWRDEFILAKNRNLDLIEFIFDYNDFEKNPLMTSKGLYEIEKKSDQTGVNVKSICADYFMESPFHKRPNNKISKSVNVLNTLIDNSSKIGIEQIIIPCVDNSSLEPQDFNFFIKNIEKCIKNAEIKKIKICLETDLNPTSFNKLLVKMPYENLKVNYDLGNSASLGYKIDEEFEAYGDWITDIHIKDRLYNGDSVELGSGDVNFDKALVVLKKINYKGIMIMQAYRDDEGIKIFDKQLDYFKYKFSDIL
tara:strand:- start:377 stop:1210 length:834 start_codon:yes stop_codon:yes gene_type:complete